MIKNTGENDIFNFLGRFWAIQIDFMTVAQRNV